ncbi:MAG: hypothetical protein JXX14_22420 [Deltaproteobacteria bacterium]|nr:hypothetical protein [Deltaproteobacteria bacterium]
MTSFIGETEVWDIILGAVTTIAIHAAALAVVGLILGILSVRYCKRKKLFVRENRIWNILAKLAYVYIPVVFLISGFSLGIVTGGHHASNRSIDKICDYSKQVIPEFKTYLETNWDAHRQKDHTQTDMSFDETVSQFLSSVYYKPKSDGFFEQKKAALINYYTLNAGKWILFTLVSVVVIQSGEAAGIDRDDTERVLMLIKEMDLSKVDSNFVQIFADALKTTISTWFRPLYLGVLLKLFLLLLPAAIEPVIYFWRRRRHMNSPALPNQTTDPTG